jgi:anti-anti-sigma factor
MLVQKVPGAVILVPTEKDLENQKQACAVVENLVKMDGESRVVVDLGQIENIYSMQIGTLVTMHVLCYENVAFMKLANVSEKVKNLLRMVGLEAMMEIHHGVDVALQSFGKEKK